MNIIEKDLVRQCLENLKDDGFAIKVIAREDDGDSEREECYSIIFSDKENNWISHYFWPNCEKKNDTVCFSPKIEEDAEYYIPEITINYDTIVHFIYLFACINTVNDINDLIEIKKGIT